jgi:hypothetical protein
MTDWTEYKQLRFAICCFGKKTREKTPKHGKNLLRSVLVVGIGGVHLLLVTAQTPSEKI